MEASRKTAGCAVTEATCIQQNTAADVFFFLRNIGFPELVHNDSRRTSGLDALSITSDIHRCVGVKLVSDESSIGREDGEKADSPDVDLPEQRVTVCKMVNQALHFPATDWTDYKHDLYLNLMEAAFVKDLYRQKYCAVDICGRSPAGEASEHSNTSSCLSSPSWFQKKEAAPSDSDSSNENQNRVKAPIRPSKQKYESKLHRTWASRKQQRLRKGQQTINSKSTCRRLTRTASRLRHLHADRVRAKREKANLSGTEP